MINRETIAALICLAFPVATSAVEVDIRLAPHSTEITFELKATMHTVRGTAVLEKGAVKIDTHTGEASGAVVVTAASAATGNTKRDKKMHSEVLRSGEYPTITVRAERTEGALDLSGTSQVTLVGVMDIIGVEHAVRIPLTVAIDGDSASVEASFEVRYVAWGLKDPSAFVLRVGKVVPVTVRADEIELRVSPLPN